MISNKDIAYNVRKRYIFSRLKTQATLATLIIFCIFTTWSFVNEQNQQTIALNSFIQTQSLSVVSDRSIIEEMQLF